MALEKYATKLEYIDYLIRTCSTGTPDQFAYKVGVSKSSLFRYLTFMKSLKAPIDYSHSKQSYYYTSDGKFHLGFVKPLPMEELKQNTGGWSFLQKKQQKFSHSQNMTLSFFILPAEDK